MCKSLVLLAILAAAAGMDLQTGRVSNRLILFGLGAGFFFRVAESGARGIFYFLTGSLLPVILFYLFFLMHALGAGDIKLFSVIGVFLGTEGLFGAVLPAFVFGAGISFVRIFREKSFWQRMRELALYMQQTFETGKVAVYRPIRKAEDEICFSVPILFGCLYYLGMEAMT